MIALIIIITFFCSIMFFLKKERFSLIKNNNLKNKATHQLIAKPSIQDKTILLNGHCKASDFAKKIKDEKWKFLYLYWLDTLYAEDSRIPENVIINMDKKTDKIINDILPTGHLLLSIPAIIKILSSIEIDLKNKGLYESYKEAYKIATSYKIQ